MLITLISPYPDITSFGIRSISAYLRAHGHATRLIFLPDPRGDDLVYGQDRYDDAVLGELIPLCGAAELVGIGLMTNHFEGAAQITRKIKPSIQAPVLWGGVHPTIRPEECLEYADIACIGEAEEAVLELADALASGADYRSVSNLCLKRDGQAVRNPLRPLTQNLDAYPRPDYSLEDHHIMLDGHIVPMTDEIMHDVLERGTVSQYLGKIGYQTMTGRGCPHQCTYCINDAVKCMYGSKGYLRWRSTNHVMDELMWVKEHMPYIGFVWISDDAFFARSAAQMAEFCAAYKEKIALPFSCLASPMTISQEKMDQLVDAGLVYVQMGVQSGSIRIQELFNRKSMTNERMLEAMRIINSHKEKLFPPSYDFILDVPYETDRDKIDSLLFIARIPKPFRLQPFGLVLYPGTYLHQKAVEDGFITDERREIYAKSYTMRSANYLNLLFSVTKGGKLPGGFLKLLVTSPVVDILNSRFMAPFFRAVFVLGKGVARAFRRWRGHR